MYITGVYISPVFYQKAYYLYIGPKGGLMQRRFVACRKIVDIDSFSYQKAYYLYTAPTGGPK